MPLKTLLLLFFITSCSSKYQNKDVKGQIFPRVSGEALDSKTWSLPSDFSGKKVILLIGYKQDSQFDIDRWLIALDMHKVKTVAYELPTIQGLFPRMFKTKINQGMRKGIPKELWGGVITIYKDGEKIQRFTGNTNPNNARVMLLNSKGKISYFYDNGFSVSALKKLKQAITKAK